MNKQAPVSLIIVVNGYGPRMETFIRNHIDYIYSNTDYKITVLCHYRLDADFLPHENAEILCSHLGPRQKRIISALHFCLRHPLKALSLIKYGRNAFNLSLFAIARQLNNRSFDLIHAHFGQNGRMIAELLDAGIIKGRLIVRFHGLDMQSSKCRKRNYYKILHKRQDDVILAGTSYAHRNLLSLGFNRSITVLPVGTLRRIPKEKSAGYPFSILFIGRLIGWKGPQLLPEIADALLEKGIDDFEINIIGDGIVRNQIAEKIAASKAIDKIHLLGYKTPLEIDEYLARADVLIYPGITDAEGREEAQGLIIQEAMMMKRPVVTSVVGGAHEAVIDGETGYHCPAGDIGSFAEKIYDLYLHPEKKTMMGENGYRLAMEKYELSKIMQTMINEVYKPLEK